MMYSILKKARSFRRREDGVMTVQFALMVPLVLTVLFSGFELGIMTLRYAYLERSLDQVVRNIRLSTGYTPSHSEIVTQICAEASVIPNCEENLKLEMVHLDPRNWTGLPQDTICTDSSETVQPVTSFEAGLANELMVLRACAKVSPLFPTTGFGADLVKDAAGDYALVVVNAFVQEPR